MNAFLHFEIFAEMSIILYISFKLNDTTIKYKPTLQFPILHRHQTNFQHEVGNIFSGAVRRSVPYTIHTKPMQLQPEVSL
jgi:hypothetical protein